MSQYTKALSQQREVLQLEEMMTNQRTGLAEEWLASRGLADLSIDWPAGKPIPQIDYESSHPILTLTQVMEAYAASREQATVTPPERIILQHALDWNEEYKTINYLSGDPYWVNWAKESLGMVGNYTKPESGQPASPAAPAAAASEPE